jgi:hypothetical protein
MTRRTAVKLTCTGLVFVEDLGSRRERKGGSQFGVGCCKG